MADKPNRRAPGGQHPVRHGLGFLVSGGTAFAVDARAVAISLAMVAGWLMPRTFTFAVPAPPSVAEFLRYAGVAWTAAALNYGLFVAILLMRPGTEPLVAL